MNIASALMCASLALAGCLPHAAAQRRRPERAMPGILGKVEHYLSKLDAEKRPYVVCATDETDEPKPMVVVVHPGGTGLDRAKQLTGQLAETIKQSGESAVILRPTGRGAGSLYMNYGEVDLFEAVEDACRKHAIDRDRISVLGHSMGGAATWYLISHYPDFFSAGNPSSGYCDYRLWEKPGGYTFHMHEWEEPSWIARSAVFAPGNFMHTPVWVVHGELDRSIGGGVPVAHSRRMTELLAAEGCPHTYTEVPGAGHGYANQAPDLNDEVLLWLIRQKKTRQPEHVRFATHTLRHNRSYWVGIEQLGRYGERGSVDAQLTAQDQMSIRTENVRTLTLGPIPERASVDVSIDEQVLPGLDLGTPQAVRRDGAGSWKTGDFDLANEKRPGCSGPIADLFFEHTILVPGTVGDEAEATFNRAVAGHQARLYRERNGGVHRGGIMGQNDVVLPIIADTGITDEQIRASNLILYGTFESNAVMKRLEGRLPVAFEGTTIRIGGKTYTGDQTTVFAVLPHPQNPGRYVAVHGGVTPDAITYGSHIDMGLLPDYLVYSGGQVLDWGFWGNDWKSQDRAENRR